MYNRRKVLLIAAAATVVTTIVAANQIQKEKKKKKRIWCRSWLQRRHQGRGVLNMLDMELKNEDPTAYRNFLRLSSTQFDYLLNLVENDITKQDTFMRDAIPARNKLEVTLRFLATGDTYRSLMYSTRIHETTISRFIPIVCEAIISNLKSQVLKTPRTSEDWTKIAEGFYECWQFPHCLGAIDGRHINFRAPISDGSYYYNYKGQNSIVLMAMCDAHYKFTYINVGVNGRISDGGVFHECVLAQGMKNNSLNVPPPEALPGRSKKVPYVFIADDAFPLGEHLMKPYPQRNLDHDTRIFNYRLSRARRIIENSFGILANRFRVLLNPINLSVSKAQLITIACVVLHNYLATENKNNYTNIDFKEETVQNLNKTGRQGGNFSNNDARAIRDEFKSFFNSSTGVVDWQENAIRIFNM